MATMVTIDKIYKEINLDISKNFCLTLNSGAKVVHYFVIIQYIVLINLKRPLKNKNGNTFHNGLPPKKLKNYTPIKTTNK